MSFRKGFPVLEGVSTYLFPELPDFGPTMNRTSSLSVNPCLIALVAIAFFLRPRGITFFVDNEMFSIDRLFVPALSSHSFSMFLPTNNLE